MNILYFLFIGVLLCFTACKPAAKNSLTLLYTSDTMGQIEPCG
jgi:hypothetical protein